MRRGRRHNNLARWAGGLALSVAAATALRADIAALPGGAVDPDGFHARESNQGVYVRDSAVALEKMALAQRMERLREWDKSADVYQEVLEKYPDRVVQSKADGKGRIYQYTSVAMAVRAKLARWPVEGLRVYESRYGAAARALLEGAGNGDRATLHKIHSLYFPTAAAREAGLRLVDSYFESGEFAAAAWLGDDLLEWRPDLGEARAGLLLRVALAYHLAGDTDKAASRAATLKKDLPHVRGRVAGKEVSLADAAEELLKTPPARPTAMSATSWPMFMGSPDRARVPDAAGRTGARVATVDLHPGRWAERGNDQVRQFQAQAERDRAEGAMLGVMPAVDRGELYFQDGNRVYAVSLESGIPLAGWARTHGGDKQGQFVAGGWGMPRGQLLTVTLTDRDVLAVVNQPDRVAAMLNQIDADAREPRLVCLDRATGAARWSITAKDLPEGAGAARAMSLSGSALVVGDNVYLAARGGKGAQFEDCQLVCVGLGDGAFRWACHIASATVNQTAWNGESGLPSETVPQLAYADGRVYVLTNLGALAAVDPYRGSIVWLDIYPREDPAGAAELRFRRFGQAMDSTSRPWTHNPVIVEGGRVFVMPDDARQVLIYDAADGTETQRINRVDLGGADTLVGVIGDRLVVAAERSLLCLNWPAYDAATFSPRNGNMIFWPAPLADPVRGRPFITRDSVFVPTARRLVRLDLAGGMAREFYPPDPASWEGAEEPGNILVTAGHVVIAGSSHVNVYTDMALAKAKLDAEIAAAQDDPTPRLRYAEMLFSSGSLDAALARLDEAADLLGGAKVMRSGPARDRLFIDALTFARKLTASLDGRVETMVMAGKMFDRAGAAADSASQRVDIRVARARFNHKFRDFAGEVALYQQILLDPAMRVVMLADGGGARQAGAVAEGEIDTLIANQGAEVYAAFAKAAADAAKAAKDDPTALLEVARNYPNSDAAPAAMLAAAELHERGGDPRAATAVLRRLYFRYPRGVGRDRVIEAMARNYLALPGHLPIAAARLARGAGGAGGGDPRLAAPMPLPDGTTIPAGTSFRNAAAAIRELAAQSPAVARALPDFGLPAERKSGATFSGDMMMTDLAAWTPIDPSHPRWDRIVAWTRHGELAVHRAGEPKTLWTTAAIDAAPLGAAWLGDDLLVTTPTTMVLFDNAGKPKWTAPLATLPAVELAGLDQQRDDSANLVTTPANPDGIINGPGGVLPNGGFIRGGLNVIVVPDANNSAPAQPERFITFIPAGERIVVATSTGRVVALDRATGAVAWQTRLSDGGPIARLMAGEDFTVAAAFSGGAWHLIAMDTPTGTILHNWRFANSAMTPLNAALSPEGMLIYTLPDRLRGKDLYEPSDGDDSFTWETRIGANAAERPFDGMVGDEQLVLADGRALAVSDRGQFVRVVSVETGRTLGAASPDEPAGPAMPLATGVAAPANPAEPMAMELRVADDRVYCVGKRSLRAYDLSDTGRSWRSMAESPAIRAVFIGAGHVVAIEDPLGKPDGPTPAYRPLAFSRAMTPGGESGRLDYAPMIADPAGVVDWQAVDGGLYHLAGDGRAYFVRIVRGDH